MSVEVDGPQLDWGPLSEPVHQQVDIPEGNPAWKDNAYLCIWDHHQPFLAAIHVSTSPNAEGRRARFSVCAEGRTYEVVETLEPGTFKSESIDFDVAGNRISVDSPQLSGEVFMEPRFVRYTHDTDRETVPSLVPGQPLQHHEQAADVTGRLVVDGTEYEIDGWGYRDRTWGWRDESANWAEYIIPVFVMPTHVMTCHRFKNTDGTETIEGYRLDQEGVRAITAMSVTREASGLWAGGTVRLESGDEVSLRIKERLGGIWVPMGWERTAPALCTYDEFLRVTDDTGEEGFALVEQASLKTLC